MVWLHITAFTAAAVLVTIVAVVVVVQREVAQPAAQVTQQATTSYAETFDTAAYRDTSATTANWDTAAGQLGLPTIAGAFYKADRSTIGLDDLGSAYTPHEAGYQVALDAQNNPHVVFGGPILATVPLMYGRWDESSGAWVGSDGTPGFEDVSASLGGVHAAANGVSIQVTSQGQPAITWTDSISGTFSVFFTTYDPLLGTWTKADGTAGFDTISTLVGDSTIYHISLALDSADRPNIAWANNPAGPDLFFRRWNGATYSSIGAENVSNTGTLHSDPIQGQIALKLDATDRPHLAWADTEDSLFLSGFLNVYYVRANAGGTGWEDVLGNAYSPACLGTTCSTANVTGSLGVSGNSAPDLELPGGQPALVWKAPGTPAQIRFTRWDAGSSTWVGPDGVVGGPSIMWQVSSAGTFGLGSGARRPQLEYDGAGNPVVGWHEKTSPTERRTKLTRWDGSAFVMADRTTPGITEVPGNTFPGATSLDLDSFGNAAVVAVNLLDGKLNFTRWLEPCGASAAAQSITVDTVGDPIQSATLTATQSLNGGTIDYFLSNDGGATIEPATTGDSHTFSASGSDLRWRAVLTRASGDVTACPSIESLSIDINSAGVAARIAGQDPVELAINVSLQAFPQAQSAPVAVIGRSDLLIDEFVSTPLVSLSNATLLLTAPSSLDVRTLSELQRVLAPGGKVYLLGGEVALSPAVVQQLAAAGFTSQERLGGERRFETAVAIGTEVVSLNPSTSNRAFLTESDFLVDAFSAGPAAGDKSSDGRVDFIVLSERGSATLNSATAGFLAAQSQVSQVEIVGGTDALPAAVESELALVLPAASLARRAGQNRFATGEVLNNIYFSAPTVVIVANGEGPRIPGSLSATSAGGSGLFSALLAGAYASKLSSPLVLTKATSLPAESARYLSQHAATLGTAYVVGSLQDVSDQVLQQVQSLL